jgi:hypothetical protein
MTDTPVLAELKEAATAKRVAATNFAAAKRAAEEARNRQAETGKLSTNADAAFDAALSAFVAEIMKSER